MNEKELFEEVLKQFIETYRLEIERPYDDSYIVIIQNGNELGGLNPSGHNLLYNLTELCNILNNELL